MWAAGVALIAFAVFLVYQGIREYHRDNDIESLFVLSFAAIVVLFVVIYSFHVYG